MKKMLKRFFLLLVLFCSMSYNIAGGEGQYNEEQIKQRTDEIERYDKILTNLSVDLKEELSDLAYDLDSIPIQSPISVEEIQRISGYFGNRYHPILKVKRFHHGVDFVAPVHTQIKSTADGVVVKIKKSDHGYGNQIVIKHGNNYETRYAHLSDITVKVGQKVEVGDVIGTLGSTGLATGPHLHYEIINNNNQINPLTLYVTNVNKDYISTLTALETT